MLEVSEMSPQEISEENSKDMAKSLPSMLKRTSLLLPSERRLTAEPPWMLSMAEESSTLEKKLL